MRVHILGASGSGTTTLGAAVAKRLDCAHFDTDTFYWEPSEPPFQQPRPVERRRKHLARALSAERWVLSGSLCGWGAPYIGLFQWVVFLSASTETRLARLREREERVFGAGALEPGGSMFESHRDFLGWARAYDEGTPDMRSLAGQTRWLRDLDCPVLRLDGEKPVELNCDRICEQVSGAPSPTGKP